MYGPPYADITACWRWNLRVENVDALRFERRAWFPSSIQRGVCKHCDNPVLGHMQLPYYGISFVGTRNWKDTAPLPDPIGHIHVQSKVQPIDDDLPQTSGVMKSHLVATAWFIPRLLFGR